MDVTPAARPLEEIMAEIPEVECVPGCRACCGGVPMATTQEADAFFPSALGLVVEPDAPPKYMTGRPCPKAKPGDDAQGCSIHDKRPFFCRIFGTVDGEEVRVGHPSRWLVCPKGAKPLKPLSAIRAQSLVREYFALTHAQWQVRMAQRKT